MSIPVDLDRLPEETERYRRGAAYLLTVGDDERPHVVAVVPEWEGARLRVSAGARSRANASRRPDVSLLWAPPDASGYSLIVNGQATEDTAGVVVAPATAVLHRPAAGAEAVPAP